MARLPGRDLTPLPAYGSLRGWGPAMLAEEDGSRFDIHVRFAPKDRDRAERIAQLRISDSQGRSMPLAQLAEIRFEDGPAQISWERGRRRIRVETNVRGRDFASFVGEARTAAGAKVALPPVNSADWGGQFKNLHEATARLVIVVPAALGLILGLLSLMFGSARLSALIFMNELLAASGGVLPLWVRGLPFSISAAVGFIALFGISIPNAVVGAAIGGPPPRCFARSVGLWPDRGRPDRRPVQRW